MLQPQLEQPLAVRLKGWNKKTMNVIKPEKEPAKKANICIAGCAIAEVHPAAIYRISGIVPAGE